MNFRAIFNLIDIKKIIIICYIISLSAYGQTFDLLDEFSKIEIINIPRVNLEIPDIGFIDEVYIDLKSESNGVLSKNMDQTIQREILTQEVKTQSSSIKRAKNYVEGSKLEKDIIIGFKCFDFSDGKVLASDQEQFDFIRAADSTNIVKSEAKKIGFNKDEQVVGIISSKLCSGNIKFRRSEEVLEKFSSFSDSYMNFLLKESGQNDQDVKSDNGAILLELENSFDRIDIDQEYQSQVYIDENGEVTKQKDNAKYIAFLGVKPGNALLTIKFGNEEIDLFTAVYSKEITIEKLALIKRSNQFTLLEKDLLTTNPTAIDLSEDDIWVLNFPRKKAYKKSNSMYEFNFINFAEGERLYFELEKNSYKYIVGIDKALTVEVPSDDMRDYIFSTLNIRNPKLSCIIQLNLNNPYGAMKYQVSNGYNYEPMEMFALDSDGKFSSEISDLTEKVFLIGNSTSAVDIKLSSGSTESYLRTYCAPNVYLIEHL